MSQTKDGIHVALPTAVIIPDDFSSVVHIEQTTSKVVHAGSLLSELVPSSTPYWRADRSQTLDVSGPLGHPPELHCPIPSLSTTKKAGVCWKRQFFARVRRLLHGRRKS
jgi:hypothetical protein